MSAKKVLKTASYLLIGFVLGALSMCYIAKNSSKFLLHMVELSYVNEQTNLAKQSRANQNLGDAILHAQNAVDVSTKKIRCFDSNNEYWSFGFPVATYIMEMVQGSLSQENQLATDEALRRALLAQLLVENGMTKEGEREYSIAAKLLGHKDTLKIKNLANEADIDD